MMRLFLVLVIACFIVQGFSQSSGIPVIGSKAPSFIAETTKGTLHFPDDYGKSWKILFCHPADFTPVCTSEILQLALMQSEFEKLNAKLVVLSTDEISLHNSWVRSMDEMIHKTEPGINVSFPLVDDSKEVVAKLYGMIAPAFDSRRTVRGVFIIDPENRIEAMTFYPKNIGRNLEEIKRTVIALQTSNEHSVLTPVNWKPGEAVLLPYPYPYNYYDSIKGKDQGYYNMSWYMLFKKLEN